MLQSIYTTAVVNQLVDDRHARAARVREATGRRRRFGRGARRAAPLTASSGRLRVSGAGR
jgi:hypothetical protein